VIPVGLVAAPCLLHQVAERLTAGTLFGRVSGLVRSIRLSSFAARVSCKVWSSGGTGTLGFARSPARTRSRASGALHRCAHAQASFLQECELRAPAGDLASSSASRTTPWRVKTRSSTPHGPPHRPTIIYTIVGAACFNLINAWPGGGGERFIFLSLLDAEKTAAVPLIGDQITGTSSC